MGTQRQKKIAKLIVENTTLDKPLNGGEMLEKVSYSEGIQKQPSRVLNSEGVLEELEILGFTEQNAKQVVAEIMLDPKKEPNARLKATDQVFKVRGSYAPEKRELEHKGKVEMTGIGAELAKKYEDELKGTI